MAEIKTRMAMGEFLEMPESNRIIELIDGEVNMPPPPLDIHQQAVGSLYLLVHRLMEGGTLRLAPTGIYVDEANFVEPDIFWVRENSADCILVEDGKYWRGAPDLVIEVRSPSTALQDKREKYELYQKSGVREYWIVAPEAQYIEVFRLQEGRFILHGVFGADNTFESAALGGKTVDVAKVFGD